MVMEICMYICFITFYTIISMCVGLFGNLLMAQFMVNNKIVPALNYWFFVK